MELKLVKINKNTFLISQKDKQGHIVLERLNQHPNNRV
jgi:hypothetical protein